MFGELIKARRLELGLKQTDVYNALELTDRVLTHWENDQYLPAEGYLKGLSKILHIPFTQLRFSYLQTKEMSEEDKKKIYAIRGYCDHCFGGTGPGACYEGGYFWIVNADQAEIGPEGKEEVVQKGQLLTKHTAEALCESYKIDWISQGLHKDVYEVVRMKGL